MPTSAELASITQTVVAYGLLIGIAFGGISQATRFCTLGAVSDWLVMGNSHRLRMWLVAMASAVIATQGLIVLAGLDATATFYTSPRLLWLSNIAGGIAFGIGMALASGCGVRTLVRVGEGNLKGIVVFLVMALAALMTLRGLTAVWRTQTLDQVFLTLPSRSDMPSLIGWVLSIDSTGLRLAIAFGLGLLLLLLALRPVKGQKQWWAMAGSIGIGLLIAAGWASTGILGFVEEHPDTLTSAFVGTNSRSPESLTFVGPLGFSLELLLYWSDRSQVLSFAIASVVGISLGALASALLRKQFRLVGFQSIQDLGNHMVGAALMGVGGVVAMGCTIGHGLSGISMLSLGSLISLLAIGFGIALGIKILERQTPRV